jgi:cytochrome oxidase Cu insertion factor (SCO1/SenC/PrrC family)
MLSEKLAAIRAFAKARLAPEDSALMQRDIDDLRAGGILDRVVKVGERAPDFTLPNREGTPVSLAALRAKGPVVLTFFRGRW